MSKWSSRKFWLTLVGDGGGAITALTGYLTGDKELIVMGIATAVALTLGYLKSEKDVDVARAQAEAEKMWHAAHIAKE